MTPETHITRYPTQEAARAAQRERLGADVVDRVEAFMRVIAASAYYEAPSATYDEIEEVLGCWPCQSPDEDSWFLGNMRFTRPDGPVGEHLLVHGHLVVRGPS